MLTLWLIGLEWFVAALPPHETWYVLWDNRPCMGVLCA